ncbi:transmembrane transporter [Calycina marina]|uniref:Transmembrane transporter n=1 Tax=Calycina marina TaxID=1763456 RepID=A0A9P7Z726_9HELO|nr:transmembrane transporter [Calycina marina]
MAASGGLPLGPLFLTWALNNSAGPSIRAVAVGGGGEVLATWTYVEKGKPNYTRGQYTITGADAIALCLAVVGILYAKWENKRARGERDPKLVDLDEDEQNRLG